MKGETQFGDSSQKVDVSLLALIVKLRVSLGVELAFCARIRPIATQSRSAESGQQTRYGDYYHYAGTTAAIVPGVPPSSGSFTALESVRASSSLGECATPAP